MNNKAPRNRLGVGGHALNQVELVVSTGSLSGFDGRAGPGEASPRSGGPVLNFPLAPDDADQVGRRRLPDHLRGDRRKDLLFTI